MKTTNFIYALSLTIMAIFFTVSPADAKSSDLFNMMDQLDKLDQQDFQDALDKANDCTRARDFFCSEDQLRKAAKLTHGSQDKQTLNTATRKLQAEKQQVEQEVRAREERERQIQLAEERREEERRDEERREEESERRRMAQREQEESSSSYSSGYDSSPGNNDTLGWLKDLNKIDKQIQARAEAERRARERAESEREARARAEADRRDRENERIRQQNKDRQQLAQQQTDQRATEQANERRAQQQLAAKQQEQEQARQQQEQERKQQQARNTATSSSYIVGRNDIKNTESTTAGVNETKKKEPEKPAAKIVFRKVPNNPPRGSAPEELTKKNGEYKCDAINAYARQYGKAVDQLFKERMSAKYLSDAKCQARCDLLAWREEIIDAFHYGGSWSCSDTAVGLWNGVDAGGGYSSYHDGKNDDRCTCVTSNDSPMSFSAKPK